MQKRQEALVAVLCLDSRSNFKEKIEVVMVNVYMFVTIASNLRAFVQLF